MSKRQARSPSARAPTRASSVPPERRASEQSAQENLSKGKRVTQAAKALLDDVRALTANEVVDQEKNTLRELRDALSLLLQDQKPVGLRFSLRRAARPGLCLTLVFGLLFAVAVAESDKSTVEGCSPPIIQAYARRVLQGLEQAVRRLVATGALGPVVFLGAAPLLLQFPLIARWHEMAKWLLGLGGIAGAMALAYRAGGRLETAGAEHVEDSALQQEIFLEALQSHVQPFSLTFFERWLHEWQADYALGTTVFLLFGEMGGVQLPDVVKLIRSPLLRQPLRQLLELEPLANCSSGGCTRRMEEFFARATTQGGRGLLLVHKADECRTDDLLGDVVGGVERLMDAKGTLEVMVDGTPSQASCRDAVEPCALPRNPFHGSGPVLLAGEDVRDCCTLLGADFIAGEVHGNTWRRLDCSPFSCALTFRDAARTDRITLAILGLQLGDQYNETSLHQPTWFEDWCRLQLGLREPFVLEESPITHT